MGTRSSIVTTLAMIVFGVAMAMAVTDDAQVPVGGFAVAP